MVQDLPEAAHSPGQSGGGHHAEEHLVQCVCQSAWTTILQLLKKRFSTSGKEVSQNIALQMKLCILMMPIA